LERRFETWSRIATLKKIDMRTMTRMSIVLVVAIAAVATGVAAYAQSDSAPATAPSAIPSAAHDAGATASSVSAPGTVITSDNASAYAKNLPAAAALAVQHGFKIKVVPTDTLQWSAGFQSATEKYSPQVALDKDDYIINYVAGMPFPLIDANDPKAAVKIAYNWHMGPVLPDDFSLSPWSSNGYLADPHDPTRLQQSDKFDSVCDKFDFLRYAHRTEVDPRPTLGSNSSGVEWKAKCNQWSTISVGGSSGEGAGIWIRYLDPRAHDEFYNFSEESRRVRRTEIALEYSDNACHQCHQPYWAYALPKTEIYTYRLLSTAPILACMNADDEPAGITPSESWFRLTQEPFQMRRAYILEMTPTQNNLSERTLIFIDSEIYVWLAAEFYEGGERVATAIPLWRQHPSPEGGNRFNLAGSFYFSSTHPDFVRSVVPPNTSFTQKINAGEASEHDFLPQMMIR
jgi:hypothetical protein